MRNYLQEYRELDAWLEVQQQLKASKVVCRKYKLANEYNPQDPNTLAELPEGISERSDGYLIRIQINGVVHSFFERTRNGAILRRREELRKIFEKYDK